MSVEHNKIVIGIDQSYKDTGVSIVVDGKIVKISNITFKNDWSNSQKRTEVKQKLSRLFAQCIVKSSCVTVVLERIRLRSDGFINIDYIKSIGALNAVIVDAANDYGLEAFTVDTRAWKSKIVGTTKQLQNSYGFDPKKWPTIRYIIKQGFEEAIKEPVSKAKRKAVIEKNGERFTYNDNKADSACIALFGYYGDADKLQKEH